VVEPARESTRDVDVLVIMSHLAAHRGLIGWLTSALRDVPGTGPITLVPWQRLGPDVALAEVLARRLRGRATVAAAPGDMADGVAAASTASVAVCLRFHGAMACALAGTPFVAVGHEPKLRALARRLHAPCVDAGCAPNDLTAALRAAREQGPASTRVIEVERRRAHEAMRLVRLMLNEGSRYEDAMVPSLTLVDGAA
jgi:polysaccharide pyruvyl transferase WcaK-like protein